MKSLFFILVVSMMVGSYGQVRDVVYLKNGSELKGKVLKNNESGVTLKMRGGMTWNFPADQVSSVDTDGLEMKVQREYKTGRVGFYNRTSVGSTFWGPSVHTAFGYAFNAHWEFALGLGVERYSHERYVPLFMEARYNFLARPASPFIATCMGQAFLPEYRDPGGFTGSLFAGYDVYLFEHLGFMVAAGYSFAHPRNYGTWYNDFYATAQIYRLEIRAGLIFR
jgi:hypothetical protein